MLKIIQSSPEMKFEAIKFVAASFTKHFVSSPEKLAHRRQAFSEFSRMSPGWLSLLFNRKLLASSY
jgi:hypothetical protein